MKCSRCKEVLGKLNCGQCSLTNMCDECSLEHIVLDHWESWMINDASLVEAKSFYQNLNKSLQALQDNGLVKKVFVNGVETYIPIHAIQ